MKRLSPFYALVAALALSSCAVGPNYHRPDLQVPTAFKHAPAEETPPLNDRWWTMFQEDDLNRLVEEARRSNQTMAAAMARVDQARAATREARADFFPSLSFDPSVRRSRSPASSTTAGGGRTTTTYSLPLDLSYEIDIWGRLRRQYEYYKNTERASAADYAVVMQTQLADVAQGYFALRLYDRQTSALKEAQDLFGRQLDLTKKKNQAGLAPQTDVLQAQNLLDSAQNQLYEAQRNRAKQENALAILIGQPPSGFELQMASRNDTIPTIPAGLPASLLSRRPDVAEAEAKLRAANAQIGVAEANFLPTLSLTGSAGFESVNVRGLTNWQNRVWSGGAGLSLPIFQGGRLTAALAGAKAAYEEAVANYRGAVLTAYGEVEDALIDLHYLSLEANALQQTLTSARENVRLSELQYRQGLNSYLEVITASQTLLNTELTVASVYNQRAAATILLIKALGGGWDPEQPVGKLKGEH